MSRKQVGAIDEDLLSAVDRRAQFLGQTRRVFVERALRDRLAVVDYGFTPNAMNTRADALVAQMAEMADEGLAVSEAQAEALAELPVSRPGPVSRPSVRSPVSRPVSRQHSPTCQCAMCK